MATTDESSEMPVDDTESETETRASDIAVLAAGVSVLLSLYEFYVRGNEQRGIFVGHWAPTILAFATYLKGRRE